MADRVYKAAVLGAGVMGTGIAAHLAGAGIRTHLLDIVPPDLDGAKKTDPAARNRFATEALQKALKARPAAFFDPECARLITPGNLEDHLGELAGCDLVIEAVVENLEIKRRLFARVAEVVGPDTLVASNTSGLSIAAMSEVLPESLQGRFLVLHFFNPVRYMHLLEVVPGPKTTAENLARGVALGDLLGKGVVRGKDTPNFVANRIGTYALMKTVALMQEMGLSVEAVDKIVGPPMGRPKSAAFQTVDLVGLDTFAHVAKNCFDSLVEDEERAVFALPDWIQAMVKRGALGRKSGAGFYKKVGQDIQVIDLATGEYRPQAKVRYESLGAVKGIEDSGARLKALVAHDDEAGRFAWRILAHTLIYAARRIPAIAEDVAEVDNAMRWGFAWDLGPFEAWDAIGVPESVKRMQSEGLEVPAAVLDMLASGRTSFYGPRRSEPEIYDLARRRVVKLARDPRAIDLAALKEDKARVIRENLGASLVDLGDGVLCFETHTKLNTIDDDVTRMLAEAVAVAEKDFEALVIGNQGQHFGAGANLMLIYMGAMQGEWGMIGGAVKALQDALQGLRYAKVPVIAAPFQYTFGGCAELAMAADACQAQAETYMGLVEVGVGLIPAGAGCLRMVERWTEGAQDVEGADLLPFIAGASLNIAMAKVATGAEEAKRLRYLRPSDGVSLHRSHHLFHAKERALGMARAGYQPPRPRVIKAAGVDAAKTISQRVWGMVEGGFATAHDALIARKVAHVVCGGNVAAGTELTEQHFLDLEREAFLSLCGEEKSQARMQSMLMSNKPLRN